MIEEQVDVGFFLRFAVDPEFGNGPIAFHVRRRVLLTAAVDDCPNHGSAAFPLTGLGFKLIIISRLPTDIG
jgi:hypothetical protein